MATIKTACPSCRHPFVLDATFSGKTIECPTCSYSIQVPYPEKNEHNTTHSDPEANKPNEKGNPQKLLSNSTQQAKAIFEDLRQISFEEEVIPIDRSNIHILLRDFAFWAVTLLGTVPLLIVTIQDSNSQLTLFALFFALVWGVILKKFVLDDPGTWRLPVASLFFTGVIGIWLLLFIYRYFLPDFYLFLPDSENSIVSLFGFIFQVGVWEELLKALPLLLVIKVFKLKIKPLHLVTIGVFSGLGFAAFENLHYGENAIASAYSLTRDYGMQGLVSGVQNAMVVTMLRALSLVLCHAVWSGILAYFIATALIRKEKVAALIILGLMVVAVLHGLYDWLAGVQPTIAALLAGFSFALLYGYLLKLRSMVALYNQELPEND